MPPPQLPPTVRVVPGGLETIEVTTPAATAAVVRHGAHVVSWQPVGHDPVIFTSEHARFEPGTAIRGGIPICFPWFGAGPDGDRTPSHGFARLRQWRLVAAEQVGDDVDLAFELTDDEPSRRDWPYSFTAGYRVTVGERLTAALTVRNTGEGPITYEAALHTYLAVGDYLDTTIHGLEGVHFDDAAHDQHGSEPGPLRPVGPVDRVYLGTEDDVEVCDATLGRAIRVATTGSLSTIVWNPGPDGAAGMADLGDDEWRRMVCVESANVRADAITLAPGEGHRLALELSVHRLG